MTDETPKRRRGCLFYGCLTGAVCLAAILLALLLGVYQLKKMFNQYTDNQPMPLPALQMSQPEIEQTQRSVEGFLDAVRAGRSTPPLALTGDEINAIIAANPDLRALRNKVYVSIRGNQLKAQVSVPMEEIGLPRFKGRYLNGTATLAVSLQNGMLVLIPQEIVAKGKPLPEWYMSRIRRQNLAAGFNDNPRVSIAVDRLQDVQVKDGKLVIVPKQETSGKAEG
jgi:hypothetical protein